MTANSFSRTLERKTIVSTYFEHTLFQRKTHYILTCSYQTLEQLTTEQGGTHWRGVAEWQTDKCLDFFLNARILSQVMDSASLLHHRRAGQQCYSKPPGWRNAAFLPQKAILDFLHTAYAAGSWEAMQN